MGYSLREDIERSEARIEFLKEAGKEYPDLQDMEVGDKTIYVSDKALADCLDVAVFDGGDCGHAVLLPSVMVAGGRVYGAHWKRTEVREVLRVLKEKSPAAYAALVRIVKFGA